MNFINLPDKFYIEGIQRIDIRDKIFREIAANMLIHREYSHPFPAKFLIFSDKVVTENWTKPAGHNPITLENLETHPKNPMVARVFKELGWVEELGSGRKNIIKYSPYYYENYRIEIKNEEKFIFSLTYWGEELNDKINDKKNDKINIINEPIKGKTGPIKGKNEPLNDKNEPINDKTGPINDIIGPTNDIIGPINDIIGPINDIIGPINDIIEPINDIIEPINDIIEPINDKNGPLNDKIKKQLDNIVLLLFNNQGMKRNDLIIKIGISRTSIFRYLQILQNANIIEYIGSRKTGGYYLTPKAKNILQKNLTINQ